MIFRLLVLVPSGNSLPGWLNPAGKDYETLRLEWKPGLSVNSEVKRCHAVVICGWADPSPVVAAVSRAIVDLMIPGPYPVVVSDHDWNDRYFPGVSVHDSAGESGSAAKIVWLAKVQAIRRKASFRNILLTLVTTLALLAGMGSGLLTMWSSRYDTTLQNGLMLLDGLEGPRPRLMTGSSLQALRDRFSDIGAWRPTSPASFEITGRMSRAHDLLGRWIAPLEEASSWPEIEETGSLARLRSLAERVRNFHPDLPMFDEVPLGREALAYRDEITKGVDDATRAMELISRRVEARRESLGLFGYRKANETDWNGWHKASQNLLDDGSGLPFDSPLMMLEDVRQAVRIERESLLDLIRAREMTILLGLVGTDAQALLVPPESSADASAATNRLLSILDLYPMAESDLTGSGLPTVFMSALRERVRLCRAGWISGGAKQIVGLINPMAGGLASWRLSIGKTRRSSLVAGWNRLLGILGRMEIGASHGAPIDDLEKYFNTPENPIPMSMAILDFPASPVSGDLHLVVENLARSGATVRLVKHRTDRLAGVLRVTFHAEPGSSLAWLPGENCVARLMSEGAEIATWRGPNRQVVGTEGLSGQASSGIRANLSWPVGSIPLPPPWFVDSIR